MSPRNAISQYSSSAFDFGSATYVQLFEEQTWISQLLIQVLVEQGKYEQALEASELGKARVTSAIMLRPEPVDTTNTACAGLVNRLSQMSPENLQQLEENFSGTVKVPNIPGFPGQPLQNPNNTNITPGEKCDFSTAVALARRNSGQLNIEGIEPPNLDNIRQIAQEQNATIVEYSIISKQPFGKFTRTEDELFIWVVRPDGQVSFKSTSVYSGAPQASPSTPLSTLIFNWRCFENEACKVEPTAQLNRGERSLFNSESQNAQLSAEALEAAQRSNQEELKQLYQLLLRPIENELPSNHDLNSNERVIIIPEQSLFVLPFAALIDNEGKYLIEKYHLSTAASIETLRLAHQKSKPLELASLSGGSSLIVGNPEMPTMGDEAPFQLAALPGAEREAEAVASLLNAEAITNSLATKELVLSRINEAKIVHLATHGILEDLTDVGIPGALALTPSPKGKNTGWLTANEIMDLNLSSQLTVLSACNTGNGTIKGDGVIGLSRSFILGGSPSVVVSLWKVPDTPTEFLMREFYQQLKAGKSKDAALRLAMLATMTKYQDPINWASFILIGDSEFASTSEP